MSHETQPENRQAIIGGPKNNNSLKQTTNKLGKKLDQYPASQKFEPHDLSKSPTTPSGLPPELWTIVQSAPASFAPQYFLDTSRNLLENPNLTASYLARAELSYQSFADATFNPKAKTPEGLASIVKHLRPECRPRLVEDEIPGYDLEWTVVRKLIPRNPNLDAALMQTCHLFVSHHDIHITSPSGTAELVNAERYLVIYIPHAATPDVIPYYHPKVRALAMLYTYLPPPSCPSPSTTCHSPLPLPGILSIHYSLFPTYPLDTRLSRTALKLLEIIHKHSRGNAGGYAKRVQHDRLVSQKAFQDTYAVLKGRYAKTLIEGWVEQTPAEKHVFEDLGIAAFLIEVWGDMYAGGDGESCGEEAHEKNMERLRKRRRELAQRNFPGFVDIGCGNGLLVYILNAEGWHGWGFDARRRKTWDIFPQQHGERLKQLLLVPEILKCGEAATDDATLIDTPPSHNGVFPTGTFIVSNHADELTPWTPLLAYLSCSPFIVIPCCSHDFGGTRFRAPVYNKYVTFDTVGLPAKNKLPSAYASLVSWISHLTEAVGYEVEKEHLRIPSTRNVAILGRTVIEEVPKQDPQMEERIRLVRELVSKEMGDCETMEQVCRMWITSGSGLTKTSKGGH